MPLEVGDQLHSAAIHLLRRLRRRDSASGLGPAQLSALSVVVFGGPVTLGELAAAEQVRPPTMSRIAAALVRARIVERVPDPGDARVVRLRATRLGLRLLQAARQRRIADLATELRRLPKEELRTLGDAARILERVLRKWPI